MFFGFAYHCPRDRRRTGWAQAVALLLVLTILHLKLIMMEASQRSSRSTKRAKRTPYQPPDTTRFRSRDSTKTPSSSQDASSSSSSSFSPLLEVGNATCNYEDDEGMAVVRLSIISTTTETEPFQPLQTLSFCLGCPNPRAEGSLIRGLAARFGPKDYEVLADVVYAVPNDARRDLVNGQGAKGRFLMINRGEVAMVEKVKRAQKVGAVGVLIVDSGLCDESFQDCGHRAGSVASEGFAPFDGYSEWRDVTIPALIITQESGKKIRALMGLVEEDIPVLGSQMVGAGVEVEVGGLIR